MIANLPDSSTLLSKYQIRNQCSCSALIASKIYPFLILSFSTRLNIQKTFANRIAYVCWSRRKKQSIGVISVETCFYPGFSTTEYISRDDENWCWGNIFNVETCKKCVCADVQTCALESEFAYVHLHCMLDVGYKNYTLSTQINTWKIERVWKKVASTTALCERLDREENFDLYDNPFAIWRLFV